MHVIMANMKLLLTLHVLFGRGIATVRATHFAQHGLWVVNGVEDKEDLRHNSKSWKLGKYGGLDLQ